MTTEGMSLLLTLAVLLLSLSHLDVRIDIEPMFQICYGFHVEKISRRFAETNTCFSLAKSWILTWAWTRELVFAESTLSCKWYSRLICTVILLRAGIVSARSWYIFGSSFGHGFDELQRRDELGVDHVNYLTSPGVGPSQLLDYLLFVLRITLSYYSELAYTL